MINSYLSAFVDILFPVGCLGCGCTLEQGEGDICSVCRMKLPKTGFHHTSKENPVIEKFYGRVRLTHGFSYLFFKRQSNVQRLLHQLKYANQPQIGEYFGLWYGGELREAGFEKAFDILIPIPLHPKKHKKRGYNQSEHFGIGMAAALDIPLCTSVLQKATHTESQTKKSRTERIENLRNGFVVKDSSLIEGKRILLLDDVITTGATLEVCATLLLKNKAKEVSVATIALAQS